MHSGTRCRRLNHWSWVICLLLLVQLAQGREPSGRWRSSPGRQDKSSIRYTFRILDLTDDRFNLSSTIVLRRPIKSKVFKDGIWTVTMKDANPKHRGDSITFFRREGDRLLQCNVVGSDDQPEAFTAPEGSQRALRIWDKATENTVDKNPNSITGLWIERSTVLNGKIIPPKSRESKLFIDDVNYMMSNTIKSEGKIVKYETEGDVTMAELIGRHSDVDKPMTLNLSYQHKSGSLILGYDSSQKPLPSVMVDDRNQPNVKLVFQREGKGKEGIFGEDKK